MKKTLQQEFWEWFLQRERDLFRFDPMDVNTREMLFDELAKELQRVHSDLAFEFGPPAERREFVVSAAGIKSAFPAVTALVNAAPVLNRWQVIAFRPRRNPLNSVEFRGKVVDPQEVSFTLFDNCRIPCIRLFIPGLTKDDADLKPIGYLLLDEALGEYDVECCLGGIAMLPPDSETEGERHPLPCLPQMFDRLLIALKLRNEHMN